MSGDNSQKHFANVQTNLNGDWMARRRSKAGRPRAKKVSTDGVPERKAANDNGPSPALVAQRAALMAEVVRQYPESFAAPFALDADAGWLVGRLYLAGQLTRGQRDAAERLARAAKRYESLLLTPRTFDSVTLLEPRGLSVESDEQHMKRFKRAKAAYERLYLALADAGHDAQRAVARALKDETNGNLCNLRKGLDAIYKAC